MPPRQRPGANLDDSRSEASSGTRERQGAAAKNRRTANAPTSGNTAPGKDAKAAAKPPVSEAADSSQSHDGRAHIPWSSMPLSVLHDYRHAYNLPCPSAYSSQINGILLSQGIGLRSPTALAARPAKTSSSSSSKPTHNHQNQSNSMNKPTETTSNKPSTTTTTTTTGTTNAAAAGADTAPDSAAESIPPPPPSQTRSGQTNLRRVQGQDRVSKDHLAAAVRKHFNNVAISEQDAVARFLYKVREERKGRAFRLRFQP